MKKFICNGCEKHHAVESESQPKYCLMTGVAVRYDWREVTSDTPPKLTVEELDSAKTGVDLAEGKGWTGYHLPDWCKVGAWCRTERTGYFTITEIEGGSCICGKSPNGEGQTVLNEKISEARLRPWTKEEAPEILKVRRIKEKDYFDVLTIDVDNGHEYAFEYFSQARQERFGFTWAAEVMEQLDGSPCGVLEHREGEGWVR